MGDTQNNNGQEYELIDLRDLVKTLIKRARLIFGVAAVCLLAVLVVSLVMPKTYSVRSVLEIGTAPDQNQVNSPIDDPAQVAKKISGDLYGYDVRQKLGISEKNYPKIKVDNFSSDLISLSINSSNTGQAESVLKELDNAVINDYSPRSAQKKSVVSANIDVQKKDIERLTDKAQSGEAEKKAIEGEISSLNNEVIYNKEIGLILALTSDRRLLETKQQDIENLYLQINQNNQQINTMNGLIEQMRPTAEVAAPVVSQNPVSPRILLYTVLGALLGLVAGMVLAFGIEWWKKKA